VAKHTLTELGLVIPVFQNESTVHQLCLEIEKLETKLSKLRVSLNVIFVIDGSPDKSKNLLMDFRYEAKKPQWKILTLSRNFGQVSALIAGLSYSKHELNVCMSADLQDPVDLILDFIKAHRDGAQIVIGVRSRRSDGLLPKFTSRIAYSILSHELPGIPSGGFDFFMLSRDAKTELLKFRGLKRFLQGDIVYLGYSPTFIEYERGKRFAGESAYSLRRRVGLFFEFFLDISTKPMKSITYIGSTISLIGFLVAIGTLWDFINGRSAFEGFTPLFLSILVFGGIQLISIGLIGSYVLKIYSMQRQKSEFIIKSIE
jgi:dolichol-phosphate mannosyltransferase